MSAPTTTAGLREAIHHAVTQAERRKAEKDSCATSDGCGKKLALITLSFRGITIGKICRFCKWTSFAGVNDSSKDEE